MSAKTELRALLVATSGVTALVGSGSAARISADRIEQGAARPFIVFTQNATDVQTGLNGTVLTTKAVLELQCWADTRVGADALADAVQTALVGDYRTITQRADGYDAELDLEATIFTVDWWL